MSRRQGPTPARGSRATWGPWRKDRRGPQRDGTLVFGNGLFTVHVKPFDPERGLDGPLCLSIHDARRTTRHDWREFQRIKSELIGPEREAAELYPAESRVVDTANEFHLWVLPAGDRWPFGFDEGRKIANPGEQPSDEELAREAELQGITLEALKRRLVKVRQRAFREEESE